MTFSVPESGWIVLGTGCLVATACALVGSFLVLRRMALIGDAISHAILPGIALGFIWTESRQSLVMLVGASAAGLVTVWLVETLYRTRRLHEDTAIATVFPALFAFGVILVSRYASKVHLDADCVIYGKIEFAERGSMNLPSIMTVVNLAFILLLYDVLKVSTFDPQLGEALGFSPALVHYLLMAAVSLTTVACFEAVGAVLVVALLIVPPAAAYLLADRLWLMLVLAVAFGLLSAITGYFTAQALDSSISGAMATTAGAWFVAAWLVAPRHGLLSSLLRHWRLRRQFQARLLLLDLKKAGITAADASTRRLLRGLEQRGWVEFRNNYPCLTPAGEAAAQGVAPGEPV